MATDGAKILSHCTRGSSLQNGAFCIPCNPVHFLRKMDVTRQLTFLHSLIAEQRPT